MNDYSGTRSNRAISRLARLGTAWSVVGLALDCASARFDPERNQALTFDTVASADAGVGPPQARSAPVKLLPSQLGVSRTNEPLTIPPSGTKPQADPITCTVDPPDPKPLHTRDWIVYEFTYSKGLAEVRSQRREQTAKPRDAARVVGRYAIELWIGCELVERVRFSFPLQAAEQTVAPGTRHDLHEQPSLTANASLARTVFVPLDMRATRAELVDHGTGKRLPLAWPPNLQPISPFKPSK